VRPQVNTRHQYDALASLYLPIALVVFVLVVTVFAVFLRRFRAGARSQASDEAQNMRAESAWIALVAVIVVVLLVATLRTEMRIDAVADAPAVGVTVTAAKWDWRFTYSDGTTLRNEVFVPAGRTIRFDARSLDVVHSFWIPDRRFQRQVWPEHVEHFDLVFDHPGTYQGVCAMFCGLRHQNMHFVVRALDARAYADWAAEHTAR
jgi:cytochrome c oxidase subunit 2